MEARTWSNQVNELIKDIQDHPCLWDCMHPDCDNEAEKNLHYNILYEKYQCDCAKVMFIWNEIIVTYFLVSQNIQAGKPFNHTNQSTVSLLALVYSFIKNIDNLEITSEMNTTSQSRRLSNERTDSDMSVDSKKDKIKNTFTTTTLPISSDQNPRQYTATIEPENEAKDAKKKTEIYETSSLRRSQIADKECETFGQLIAIKMQHLNFVTRQILMNDIHIRVHETILQSNANRSHSSTQASAYNNPSSKKGSSFMTPVFQKYVFPSSQSSTESSSS